jgi:hypothetical protein
MVKTSFCLAIALGLMAGLTACRVRVNKDARGEQKNVQVDTPFGGVHVNTDQTTAADLGLPVYPGAVASAIDDKNNKSADVHVGFGKWQLRVRTASYESTDTQDKVAEFYRQALSKYGDVIACQSSQPVGSPKMTRDGLTCDDDSHHGKVQIHSGDVNFDNEDYQLKAGSKRHQHIVGFRTPKPDRTRFSLVSLDLPADVGKNSGKSD